MCLCVCVCEFNVGDIMVLKDHIGIPLMAGVNPLVGKALAR